MSATAQSVADTATYRDVMCRAWYITTDGVDDTSNNFSTSGDFPGNVTDVSKNISIPFGGGSQMLHEKTLRVYKQYGSTTDAYFAAWIDGINYWGGAQVYDNVTYSVPARAYTNPSAPSLNNASSVSSTSAVASWADPRDWGGDNTSDFTVQISGNSSFSGASTYNVYNVNSRSLTGLSPNTTYYIRVRAFNAAGDGSWSLIKSFTTDPNAPAAPSAVAVSRASDTQHVVTWTRNSTSAAPYQSQKVQRWDNVTAKWSTIFGTVSGTATSYTDRSTIANRRYVYRVQAVNTTATTTSSNAAAVYTTPSDPTNPAAVKSGSNIVVTWTNTCSYSEYETVVYESQDGGAYSTLATVAGGTASYTHVSPSTSVTHKYQIRHVTSSGPFLGSGYPSTNTVQLAAPPNAPTNLAPSGVAIDAVNDIALTWVHSPVDSSAQTKFQIQHRLAGAGAWTTIAVFTSTSSTWTLPADTYANGAGFEWQVKTWGIHATAGPYSAMASVTTSAIPTATISVPGASITTSTLTFTWSYYDAEGSAQAEWQAELLDGAGATVEFASDANAETTYTFGSPVADASSYTVRVQVRDGSGLWSAWDSWTFSVSYALPADVALAGVYDSGVMAITLTPDATDPGVTVDPASVAVQRRIDGGVWVTIAAELDPAAVFLDTKCATVGLNEYRAIVTSALPSSVTMSPVSITTADTRWSYLSYGPAFSIILRCYGNLEFGHGDGRDTVLNAFENRPKPVAVFGANTSSTLSVKADLDDDSTPLVDWRTAAREAETALVRIPTGRRDFGAISGFSASESDPFVTPISFTFTVVDFSG
jgi:hypothetical protein